MRTIARSLLASSLPLAGLLSGPPAAAQDVEILAGPGSRPAAVEIRMVAASPSGAPGSGLEPARPLSRAEVLAVQAALARAGVDPGPHDGVLGPRVSEALARFQAARGLPACGCLDGRTTRALGLPIRVIQTVTGADGERREIEILRPTGRSAGPPAPAPARDRPAGTDTVVVVTEGSPTVVPWLTLPVLSPGLRGAPPVAAPRGGRPLGTGAGGLRRVRPPPPPPR